MNQINVPLLRKVLEHIDAHPDEHNQNWWASRRGCGTTYCLAGHVAVLSGYTICWRSDDTASQAYYFCWGSDDTTSQADHYCYPGSIMAIAQDELGLTNSQADALFNFANTRRRLWQLAEEFTSGEIRRSS